MTPANNTDQSGVTKNKIGAKIIDKNTVNII